MEAIAPAGGSWEGGVIQLDRGPLDYRARFLDLPGVQVGWHAVVPRLQGRWRHASRSLEFFFLLDARTPLRYRGEDLGRNDLLLLNAGHEHHYVSPRGGRFMEVRIDAEIVRALGWRTEWAPHARAPRGSLSALGQVCRAITADVASAHPTTLTQEYGLACRDHVLAAVKGVLGPWLHGDPGARDEKRSFSLTEAALRLMRERSGEAPIRIGDVANDLGVSERTLYAAFQDIYDVGPYEFHRMERLHVFRDALATGVPFHGKILRVAKAAGFQDACRMTQAYRRHFGETPRQSMRRWSRQDSPLPARQAPNHTDPAAPGS